MKTIKYLIPILLIVIIGCLSVFCITFPDYLGDIPDGFEKRVKNMGYPIIMKYGSGKPNSADGVKTCFYIKNISNKTIKYIDFTVVPYNAVGDIQKGRIRNRTDVTCQFTGPYFPGRHKVGCCSNMWYNPSIKCVKMKKLVITFMNKDLGDLIYENEKDISKFSAKAEAIPAFYTMCN